MSRIHLATFAIAASLFAGCKNAEQEEAGGGSVSETPIVEVVTDKGSFKVQLNPDKAPLTVENFLDYVDAGHYDGTVFHRVIKDFMVQGGGFAVEDGALVEKDTRPPIQNEAKNGLSNTRGTIAMARTGDPHSATAQFFVNVVDNTQGLAPGGFSPDGYAVFGEVIEGMETVDKIKGVPTGVRPLTSNGIARPSEDVPVDNVVIQSIRRVE